ncbi:hypothetical protein [Dechloromonas denitrificans]|uniref:hypothetical protein n=1 Tax=Dechloromonas denitrificans TaxID=281362 RepID=UPI0012F9825F|nr:hypothetical protein [Dechloromonas denitrificans]
MSSDGSNAENNAIINIKPRSEGIDFEAIASACGTLIRALVDHQTGSPEQVLAWENGMAKMPQALCDRFPPLARLHELARKAWPTANDQSEN